MSHESDLRARLATAENEAMYLTRERDEARTELEQLRGLAGDCFGRNSELLAERDEARAQRDALGVALRRVVGRAREWGDFDATDFGDALREADEALAGLEES